MVQVTQSTISKVMTKKFGELTYCLEGLYRENPTQHLFIQQQLDIWIQDLISLEQAKHMESAFNQDRGQYLDTCSTSRLSSEPYAFRRDAEQSTSDIAADTSTAFPLDLAFGTTTTISPDTGVGSCVDPSNLVVLHNVGEVSLPLQPWEGYNVDAHAKEASLSTVSSRKRLPPERVIDTHLTIATVEAIDRLRLMVMIGPSPLTVQLLQRATSVVKTLHSLDRGEIQQSWLIFTRRMLLYLFASQYTQRVQEERACRRAISDQGSTKHVGRAESHVIDLLVHELYSDDTNLIGDPTRTVRSDWDQRARKKIRNCVATSKKWSILAGAFGLGILALIPLGSDIGGQNHSWETLKQEQLASLIKHWQSADDNFVPRAADKLTPFVQATLGGEKYPTAEIIKLADEILQEVTAIRGKDIR